MSVIKRTKYFIKPGFQSRLTAIMILLVIIVANLVGGLTYCFAYEKLTEMFTEFKVPIGVEQLTKLLLPGVLLSELISIFLVGFLCIKITHTIAGPVYRMERVARGIGEGDLTNFIKLRQRDELKDLADSMNEMTLGLRNRVINLKENFGEVRESIEATKATKDTTKLDSVIAKLDSIEETLQSFILEKEQRTRLEDEENESSDSSEYENKEESKEEYEAKPSEE
ncbi:MAG: methyl-accepting chemotaxis protein [Candidatus Riflebacteria bacterium]|nr:methyl-accepting chemotaxis protein [Candidatus Riflebacteria bacterium]